MERGAGEIGCAREQEEHGRGRGEEEGRAVTWQQ